ncbi:RHS repeat domain-containing protein [Sorangium sp. So ce542]|uniref:RHS repeat domain-containing protein n=1 Tax=Sorangium sp. So ce542 TaxID=3133316 RepID=UPI003F5F8190
MSATDELYEVPGTGARLRYEYDAAGRVVRISSGDRVYLEEENGVRRLGDLAVVTETRLPSGMIRRVTAAGRSWSEEYRWDDASLPTLVDGVEIRRDAAGRVVACIDRDGSWFYGWDGGRLASIESASGRRLLSHDATGRPVAVRAAGETRALAYDATGLRQGVPQAPRTWHRDQAGRLWAITDGDGRVICTYVWDRFACLGRIDGAPGEPLAAAFSLDMTFTPVRVITAAGATRIPRDAFGEGLVGLAGVPGLYGGAQHGGFFHYRGRALDPALGAFAAPDPFDGRDRDPRRRGGYDGLLLVEAQPGGAYAVCLGDPIARLDPTGEASGGWTFFYTLLNMTWASQYVVGGPLFLDLVVNLLVSLVGFSCFWPRDHETTPHAPVFFHKHGMHSERTGAYGYRSDSLWPVGFTFHTVFWVTEGFYNDIDRLRCFVPRQPIRPTLCGTVLECRLDGDQGRFLLDTPTLSGPRPWTRSGGPAEPVVPGARVPYFPSGGFHFILDYFKDKIVGPVEGALHELVPTGDAIQGKIVDRRVLSLGKKGLGLAANTKLFLVDNATSEPELVEVRSAVEHDGKTRIRTQVDTTFARGAKLRVRGLKGKGAAGRVEDDQLAALAVAGQGLDARKPAAKLTYRKGDPLDIAPAAGGGAAEGVLVDRLEVQITADAAVAGLDAPVKVKVAQPGGATRTLKRDRTDAALLEFPAGQAPGEGTLLEVKRGLKAVAVKITGSSGDAKRRVDRALNAADFPDGVDLDWRTIDEGRSLSDKGEIQGGTRVVYEPEISGDAPSSGYLWLKGDNGVIAVRSVMTLDHDAILLKRRAPGGAAPPALNAAHKVHQYQFADPDVEDAEVLEIRVFEQNAAVPLGGAPFHVWRLAAGALAAAPRYRFSGLAIAGTKAAGAVPARPFGGQVPPVAGSLVLTNRGGTPDAVVVKSVRLRLKLDRAHGFPASRVPPGGGAARPVVLSAVKLHDAGATYEAREIDAGRITVKPIAKVPAAAIAAGKVFTQMPRFREGELLRVTWTGAAAPLLLRVKGVTDKSTTFEFEGGALPAPAVDLEVVKLEPIPNEKRRLVGEGKIAAVPDEVLLDVLHAYSIESGDILGITDGEKTLPFKVGHVAEVEFELGAAPRGAGNVDLEPSGGPSPWDLAMPEAYSGYPPQQQGDIDLDGSSYAANNNPAWIVRFGAGTSVRGTFHSGTVLVPNEPESRFDYTRGKAVDEHELTHTRQYAWLGPLFLSLVPWFAVEGITEAAGDADELDFFYSDPKDATVLTEGAQRLLSIADPGDIPFAAGEIVQAVQAGRIVNVTLRDRDAGGRFRIQAGPELDDGACKVRLFQERSDGAKTWNKTIGALGLWSVGGIATLVTEGLIRGIAELVGAITKSANALTSPAAADRSFFPAAVPDPGRPRAIRVGARPDGGSLTLKKYDVVLLRTDGNVTSETHVFDVAADGTVELESVPTAASSLEIAQIAHDDPFFTIEQRAFRHPVYDVIRAIYDPWGQLHLQTRRDRGGEHAGLDGFLRALRYAFGSHSWIGLGLGLYTLSAIWNKCNRDKMWFEQHASVNSGDMYTAAVTMRHKPEYVGDIGSFWYTVSSRYDDVLGLWEHSTPSGRLANLDAIGLNRSDDLRYLPAFSAAGGSGAKPNLGATTPNTPYVGMNLPDALAAKPEPNPHAPAAAPDPAGFSVTVQGSVPVTPGCQRSNGAYVAFTQAGKHRATVRNDVPEADRALVAHEDGAQTIYHDLDIKPVEVTLGGVAVAAFTPPAVAAGVDPLASLPQIELLVTQRATVKVTPNGARRYAAITPRPLTSGAIRVRHDAGSDPVIEAQRAVGAEDIVEIARFFRHSGGYADPALARGVHLPEDLFIPVRWLRVKIVDTVPLRARLDPKEPPLAGAVKPDAELYLFVPASVSSNPARTSATADAGAPAHTTISAPKLEPVPIGAFRDFVGVGGIFKLTFPEPPDHPVTYEYTTQVGAPAIPVKSQFKIEPHFTLNGLAEVRIGNTIELTPSLAGAALQPGTLKVEPAANITAVIEAGKVKITATAGAAQTVRKVIVGAQHDGKMKMVRRNVRVIP